MLPICIYFEPSKISTNCPWEHEAWSGYRILLGLAKNEELQFLFQSDTVRLIISVLIIFGLALRSKMKAQALKECDPLVAKFAECAKGRLFSVVWACRAQSKETNACLHRYTNDEAFEKYKKQYEEQALQKLWNKQMFRRKYYVGIKFLVWERHCMCHLFYDSSCKEATRCFLHLVGHPFQCFFTPSFWTSAIPRFVDY